MDTNQKQFYEAPETIVLGVKMEGGLLQASNRDYAYHSLDESAEG